MSQPKRPKATPKPKKVYCNKCRYLQWRLGSHAGCFIPGDGKVCTHPSNLKKEDTPREVAIRIINMKCEFLNKNNDCKNYRIAWWRF